MFTARSRASALVSSFTFSLQVYNLVEREHKLTKKLSLRNKLVCFLVIAIHPHRVSHTNRLTSALSFMRRPLWLPCCSLSTYP